MDGGIHTLNRVIDKLRNVEYSRADTTSLRSPADRASIPSPMVSPSSPLGSMQLTEAGMSNRDDAPGESHCRVGESGAGGASEEGAVVAVAPRDAPFPRSKQSKEFGKDGGNGGDKESPSEDSYEDEFDAEHDAEDSDEGHPPVAETSGTPMPESGDTTETPSSKGAKGHDEPEDQESGDIDSACRSDVNADGSFAVGKGPVESILGDNRSDGHARGEHAFDCSSLRSEEKSNLTEVPAYLMGGAEV